jgi:DNA-binding transcriptional ArsR family regulator
MNATTAGERMRKLDERVLEALARYFAALAAPARLRILELLRDGERNVAELTAATGCTQANVSKHLTLLAQHGFVAKEARGTSAYYTIADPAIYGLCDTVCARIGRRYAEQAGMARVFRRASSKPDKTARISAPRGRRKHVA